MLHSLAYSHFVPLPKYTWQTAIAMGGSPTGLSGLTISASTRYTYKHPISYVSD